MAESSEEAGRAAWTAAALLLVVSLGGGVVLAEWPLGDGPRERPSDPELVEPVENGTKLWPYTAQSRNYRSGTLGINLVLIGDNEDVRQAMIDRSTLEWRETGPEEEETDPGVERAADVIRWGEARGATRYSYIVVGGQGLWVAESYQLHSGAYLGSRMHIRAYEDPRGEWTAMQVHDEHWDWFRLRHTVAGISDAQRDVEDDFMGAPFVDEVSRLPFGNSTADGDGWATIVRLSLLLIPVPLLGATLSERGRRVGRSARRLVLRHHRELALGAALFTLYLGIRLTGIWFERMFPGLSPKFIAAPLYVLLAVGPPTLAYGLGRNSDEAWAFTHVTGGLGTAIVVDFALMRVSFLATQVILHRLAVLFAVGLIAVGSNYALEEENPAPLLVGLIGWLLALALPALGYV